MLLELASLYSVTLQAAVTGSLCSVPRTKRVQKVTATRAHVILFWLFSPWTAADAGDAYWIQSGVRTEAALSFGSEKQRLTVQLRGALVIKQLFLYS